MKGYILLAALPLLAFLLAFLLFALLLVQQLATMPA